MSLNPSKINDFQHNLEEALPLDQVDSDPESTWLYFKDKVIEAAKDCEAAVSTGRKPWISDNTWTVIQRRKEHKTRYGTNDEYRALSKDIKKQCRKDKADYIFQICREIEEHGCRNEPRDLFQKIKLLTREFKPQTWSVIDKEGNLKTDTDEILETWRNFCDELYKNNEVSAEH
uniref:Uncharacterized protein LOC114347352 n=1 Tax=Diabrotica virgifera virgifera TaxID=50390 RepID=A0A6P7H5P7_DIAVI